MEKLVNVGDIVTKIAIDGERKQLICIKDISSGGLLALLSPRTALSASKENQIVAVEFDSKKDIEWDPSDDHAGIDVNSIVSVASVNWKSSIKTGSKANAWVRYNSTAKNLSVFLTYAENPEFGGNSSLHYIIDLREFLPEWVRIGFSASTGDWVEIHNILSWTFESSLDVSDKKKTGLVVGLAVGLGVLTTFVIGVLCFVLCWRKNRTWCDKDNEAIDASMDDEFEKGTGPKRFTYRELIRATNNFAEGESSEKEDLEEYVSEVKIISRLRHRNLVQLIGWCHERGELLLVYEFMLNGSLDSHLFGGQVMLVWNLRYKIALGLASALLYLHEEWEQCVVHRDIKSSNVMLDSNFNAKLGDFGLARLVDHELGSQTTVLAGTVGYLASECVTTGKASRESDV
ncbi:kinase [Populus alba x Populus x berolinensis]|uniref:non-specific serine/threonine protein kinase n=1 Tax=Populus alba x Populus x berolinensis TaxID=444605 RepID=A0AAD6QG12_9ROSI|nr:kinase [Populus alba x Populus x berolinensis]